MLADGIGDINGAANATWNAIRYAEEVPAAWAGVPLPCVYGLAATLLANDFEGATKLALLLTEAEPQDTRRRLEERGDRECVAEFDKAQSNAPTEAHRSALRVIRFVPIAIRLAHLHMLGRTNAEMESSVADTQRIMPVEQQPESFGKHCADHSWRTPLGVFCKQKATMR